MGDWPSVSPLVECVAYRNAALNHATSGTWQAIALDAEDTSLVDTSALHDTVTNNSRVGPQNSADAGVFLVIGHVELANNSTGYRGARIRKNSTGGALGQATLPPTPGDVTTMTAMCLVRLNAADYVEIEGFQTSTAALAFGVGLGHTDLQLVRVGL